MRADPAKVQYKVMVAALQLVARVNDWDLDDVRVWVSAAELLHRVPRCAAPWICPLGRVFL